MRTVSTIFGLTMVACLAAAAACSTKSSDSDDSSTSKKDAGKATSGDDDDTTASDDCEKACAASAGAKCKKASTCVTDCEAAQKKIPTKCQDEGDALYTCLGKTEKADWKCVSDKPALTGDACSDELTAYTKCAAGTAAGDDDDTTDPDAGDACDTCISGKCGTELTTCQGNADCVKLAQCLSKCKDQTCADQCATDNPDGVDDANAFETCLQDNCATDCQ